MQSLDHNTLCQPGLTVSSSDREYEIGVSSMQGNFQACCTATEQTLVMDT